MAPQSDYRLDASLDVVPLIDKQIGINSALGTWNSGPDFPTVTYPFMKYVRTTNGNLYIRNGRDTAWVAQGNVNKPNLGIEGADFARVEPDIAFNKQRISNLEDGSPAIRLTSGLPVWDSVTDESVASWAVSFDPIADPTTHRSWSTQSAGLSDGDRFWFTIRIPSADQPARYRLTFDNPVKLVRRMDQVEWRRDEGGAFKYYQFKFPLEEHTGAIQLERTSNTQFIEQLTWLGGLGDQAVDQVVDSTKFASKVDDLIEVDPTSALSKSTDPDGTIRLGSDRFTTRYWLDRVFPDRTDADRGKVVVLSETDRHDVDLEDAPSGGGGGLSAVMSDDTLDGNGLTTSVLRVANPFTEADEQKLDGIAAGAEVNVKSDWAEPDSSKDSFIENKPDVLLTVATDGTLDGDGTTDNPLSVTTAFTPSDRARLDAVKEQVQADWEQPDSTQVDFIKNKPATITQEERDKLASVQTGVQSDWEASSGAAAILNKPDLKPVATSGRFADLTGKPFGPGRAYWYFNNGRCSLIAHFRSDYIEKLFGDFSFGGTSITRVDKRILLTGLIPDLLDPSELNSITLKGSVVRGGGPLELGEVLNEHVQVNENLEVEGYFQLYCTLDHASLRAITSNTDPGRFVLNYTPTGQTEAKEWSLEVPWMSAAEARTIILEPFIAQDEIIGGVDTTPKELLLPGTLGRASQALVVNSSGTDRRWRTLDFPFMVRQMLGRDLEDSDRGKVIAVDGSNKNRMVLTAAPSGSGPGGGLSVVASDTTLTGSGTGADPLKVAKPVNRTNVWQEVQDIIKVDSSLDIATNSGNETVTLSVDAEGVESKLLDAIKSPRTASDRDKVVATAATNENRLILIDKPTGGGSGPAFNPSQANLYPGTQAIMQAGTGVDLVKSSANNTITINATGGGGSRGAASGDAQIAGYELIDSWNVLPSTLETPINVTSALGTGGVTLSPQLRNVHVDITLPTLDDNETYALALRPNSSMLTSREQQVWPVLNAQNNIFYSGQTLKKADFTQNRLTIRTTSWARLDNFFNAFRGLEALLNYSITSVSAAVKRVQITGYGISKDSNFSSTLSATLNGLTEARLYLYRVSNVIDVGGGGGIDSVTSDATLTGTGTSARPLKVTMPVNQANVYAQSKAIVLPGPGILSKFNDTSSQIELALNVATLQSNVITSANQDVTPEVADRGKFLAVSATDQTKLDLVDAPVDLTPVEDRLDHLERQTIDINILANTNNYVTAPADEAQWTGYGVTSAIGGRLLALVGGGKATAADISTLRARTRWFTSAAISAPQVVIVRAKPELDVSNYALAVANVEGDPHRTHEWMQIGSGDQWSYYLVGRRETARPGDHITMRKQQNQSSTSWKGDLTGPANERIKRNTEGLVDMRVVHDSTKRTLALSSNAGWHDTFGNDNSFFTKTIDQLQDGLSQQEVDDLTSGAQTWFDSEIQEDQTALIVRVNHLNANPQDYVVWTHQDGVIVLNNTNQIYRDATWVYFRARLNTSGQAQAVRVEVQSEESHTIYDGQLGPKAIESVGVTGGKAEGKVLFEYTDGTVSPIDALRTDYLTKVLGDVGSATGATVRREIKIILQGVFPEFTASSQYQKLNIGGFDTRVGTLTLAPGEYIGSTASIASVDQTTGQFRLGTYLTNSQWDTIISNPGQELRVDLFTSEGRWRTAIPRLSQAAQTANPILRYIPASVIKGLPDTAGGVADGAVTLDKLAEAVAARLLPPALGSVNQILRVNSRGTGVEYATPSGGGWVESSSGELQLNEGRTFLLNPSLTLIMFMLRRPNTHLPVSPTIHRRNAIVRGLSSTSVPVFDTRNSVVILIMGMARDYRSIIINKSSRNDHFLRVYQQ